MALEHDNVGEPVRDNDIVEDTTGEQNSLDGFDSFISKLARRGGVELRGSIPVPYEDRTVTQYLNIFSLWFCVSCNPLP